MVKGYMEEGTISTAFDMTVMNKVDRFHLVMDVCDCVVQDKCGDGVNESTKWTAPYVRQEMQEKLVKHKAFIHEYGVDMKGDYRLEVGDSRDETMTIDVKF